jgi:murein L,D-transpeptidase YcbB/YkuD
MALRPALFALSLAALIGTAAQAEFRMAEFQLTAFRQAVAENAAQDEALSAFYRARGFEGFWAGSDAAAQARRNAFLAALSEAHAHGLPDALFDPAAVVALLQSAGTGAEQAAAEVELSRLFVAFAQALDTGLLTPRRANPHIFREVTQRDPLDLLTAFAAAEPVAFFRALPPQSAEYARLVAAKARLEGVLAAGGWGDPVAADRLEPGDRGAQVVALRNRLMAMGYLAPTATMTYDAAIERAVLDFQAAHGLEQDGVAGEGTIAEVNVPVEDRLRAVIVAMERERWLGDDRGDRHVWVNQADFTAAIVDQDRVTFRTRAVIGAVAEERQSPEFSDVMEFMVINPSWYVPRSIIIREYLPALQRNAGAAGHLRITDSRGRVIDRGSANFSAFTASSFPYAMHQPPGPGNALGVVKFMFPNPYDIYLHDTPARDLFAHEVRAYSHGCIRLNEPREFAYQLLSRQTDDPEGFFAEILNTGAERRVDLEVPVPVHLDYRTAYTDVTGVLQFRRDIYGRDADIWAALAAEGVEIGGLSG